MVDRVGQQLGNYRLLRLLGKGGFAEVYLGEHVYLKTRAAVKLLQTRVGNAEDLDGFLKEAQTIAHLSHRHIVRVMDFGVDGETPFLVMDYAPNGSLRQLHPKGTQLPLASVISYTQQIASALQYAHDARLIHRDVKPENMLVGQDHDVLLSDFGIALITQSSPDQSTQDVIGTAAYMSPEQIRGKPRPASDQYSLGIVVYEWLCGVRPFHGSFAELCTQHLFAPPPSLREKVLTIPAGVEQVIITALSKDPKQRFSSVLAFATALEQASQPTGVSLPHPPMIAPPSDQVSRSTQLAPSQTPSNQMSEPTGGWTSTGKVPPPASSKLSPSQAAPQALFSLPGVPSAPRWISRRKVAVGLAGLAVVGVIGSLLWLEYDHPQSGGNRLVPTVVPKITSVSPIIPAQDQTIVITGSGFGTQQPFTNTTSNYLDIHDFTTDWRAGFRGAIVGVTVSTWTDNRIEITGFSNYGGSWTFLPGDLVIISVWNPQTYAGPALFATTVVTSLASTPTPVSTPIPKITSVSPIIPAQDQTIVITGSGFGTQQPFTNTTSNYLDIHDFTTGWRAGFRGAIVGVTVSAWTDNQIEITGFSNYGGSWTFLPGDLVIISVWNPQTYAGPALFPITVTD